MNNLFEEDVSFEDFSSESDENCVTFFKNIFEGLSVTVNEITAEKMGFFVEDFIDPKDEKELRG